MEQVEITDIMSLYSGEGDFYTSCCDQMAIECTCPRSRRTFFGPIITVADLLPAKRNWWDYSILYNDLAANGQVEPVKICVNGCCLNDGHHRIAALITLDVALVGIIRTGHCFDPAWHGAPVHTIPVPA